MDQGVIQQVGTPMELFDDPVNRFVAGFVGSVNLFDGELHPGGVFVSPTLGECRLPPALAARPPGPACLAFRPHAVRLDAAAASGDEGLDLEGRIAAAAFQGDSVRYEIEVAGARVIAEQPHHRGAARRGDGTPVRLAIPAGELRLIAP